MRKRRNQNRVFKKSHMKRIGKTSLNLGQSHNPDLFFKDDDFPEFAIMKVDQWEIPNHQKNLKFGFTFC
jgi:hypothetical protein